MEANNIKIKFSPFEALLIGEKNRIVKRQPQKNTVFVTRLNKVRKTVNLRELFDLKSDSSSSRNGSSGKFEKVCDFLKHSTKIKKVRKTEMYNIKKKKKRKDVYCYEFGGRKLIVKGDEFVEFKVRDDDHEEPEIIDKVYKHKINEKQEKNEKKTPVKFKPDFKFKETLEEKIVNKFHNRRLRSKSLPDNLLLMDMQKIRKTRQAPRAPDGKFIKTNERPNNVTPRQKFLSKYLHEIYLKKNKDVFNKEPKVIVDSDESDSEEPYSSDDDIIVLSESNKKFDVTESESKLNQISVRYHQKYSCAAINFPPYPKYIKPSDFDDDDHLIDILYEDQPRSLKSEAKENFSEIRRAKAKAEISSPSPAKIMKVYEKKKQTADDDIEVLYDSRMEGGKKNKETLKRKNGFVVRNEEKKHGFNINIEGKKNGFNFKIDEKKNGLNVQSEERKNGYNARIDQPPTMDNHLLEGTNLGTLFFESTDGNDIFLGNFVKPVLNDSPFGTIPSV